ncbi:unnamed protein product, partial [Cyprideis torosa]
RRGCGDGWRFLSQRRCWLLLLRPNRRTCWGSDSSPSSSGCTPTWLARSPGCSWRSTTPSCFTCWKTTSPSRRVEEAVAVLQ